MAMALSMILTLMILTGFLPARKTILIFMAMMMLTLELGVTKVLLKRSGPQENNSINATSSNLKRSRKSLRMHIKMFMKLYHLSLPKKTLSIKKLEAKCLKLRKWGLNSERKQQKELPKKEELQWSVKRLIWKNKWNKERESHSRLKIRNRLRIKPSNYIAKLKSCKDRSFLSRMLGKK